MIRLAALGLFCAAALIGASACPAEIRENRYVVFDFTKENSVRPYLTWTDAEAIRLTDGGLGFDGKANQSRDVRIEIKKPLAVGWSWQPATTVTLRAEVEPPGKFRITENSITWPSTAGVMYARYSPDGRNWSTWQPLSLREPRRKGQPRLVFFGQLRVPSKVREPYIDYLKAYAKKDRYLGDIDEEAAVKALVKERPDYFKKHKPFIGYVDFLWETQIRGHERLQKLTFELGYSMGGRAPTPEGHRESERWRFRAEE